MSTFFIFLVTLALLPYLLFPLVIRKTQRFKKSPSLRRVLPDFLPVSVKSFFHANHSVLLKEGFIQCFDAVSNDHAPHVRVFTRMYVEPKRSILALATALLPSEGPKTPLKTFIEFVSKFRDGTEINTNNCELVGAPIEPQKKITRTFQFVQAPQTLLHLHQYFLNKKTQSKVAIFPAKGEEFSSFEQSLRLDLEAQESIGGLSLDKTKTCYRPTWAGAVLMAWYTMWPFSFIRSFFRNRKARKWLRQLNATTS